MQYALGRVQTSERVHAPAPAPSNRRFDDFVRRYHRGVTRAAYDVTRNIDDARDVAQHVFLQLFCKRPHFVDERAARRWLYVVTRNEALNVRRRGLRDAAAAGLTRGDDVSPGLEETVVQNERARHVRDTISRLPSVDRDIIELRYLRAFSTVEIAADLGLSPAHVKRAVRRAKWRLRNVIVREGIAAQMF